MNKLLELLNDLCISYDRHDHPALHTVEEAKEYDRKIGGMACKNMFLKDKKGDYFLFSCPSEKVIDTKILKQKIGCKHLSFASPIRLKEVLDLTPGSVCPFGLVNDKNKVVTMVLDKEIVDAEKSNFHPLINTSTLTITSDDLLKFIKHCGNELKIVEME